MENVFSKYLDNTKVHKIKALGAEVTLRDLTLKEIKDVANSMIKGTDSKGNPEIDYEKANESKLLKISMALVEPKMTVPELEALGRGASDAIDEIFAIVDPATHEATERARKNAEAGKKR